MYYEKGWQKLSIIWKERFMNLVVFHVSACIVVSSLTWTLKKARKFRTKNILSFQLSCLRSTSILIREWKSVGIDGNFKFHCQSMNDDLNFRHFKIWIRKILFYIVHGLVKFYAHVPTSSFFLLQGIKNLLLRFFSLHWFVSQAAVRHLNDTKKWNVLYSCSILRHGEGKSFAVVKIIPKRLRARKKNSTNPPEHN